MEYAGLVNRQVEVLADGIVYRGRLVEMTEAELQLEGESGWIVIGIDRVADVRLHGEGD